jgi:2-polyprenyl-6-methoxyphenol hydroxylase-like FAD-dependent oxidoreductase
MDLAGSVALVTGAGSGIGRATALQLARGGAAVAVSDIDEPSARETAGLIEHHAGRATAIRADVADDTEVRRMIASARERDTPMVQRTRADLSPEEWQAIAPAVMTQPEEIAGAVVRIIMDESLAGRVLLCVGPKPWPLAEPASRAR